MKRRKNTRADAPARTVFARTTAATGSKSVNLLSAQPRRKTSCHRSLPPPLSRQRTSIYSGRMCRNIEITGGDVAASVRFSRAFDTSNSSLRRRRSVARNALLCSMRDVLFVASDPRHRQLGVVRPKDTRREHPTTKRSKNTRLKGGRQHVNRSQIGDQRKLRYYTPPL